MRRLGLVAVGLALLTGCAASAATGTDEVVAGVGAGGRPPGELEVLQGTVTGVAEEGNRVEVLVRLVWAPVLRAENRTVEVDIGPDTRFVPPGFSSGLREGDEVQVSIPLGEPDRPQAAEIAVLDLG